MLLFAYLYICSSICVYICLTDCLSIYICLYISQVLIYVHVAKALAQGFPLFLSDNEVALTPEIIPPALFMRVVRVKDGKDMLPPCVKDML